MASLNADYGRDISPVLRAARFLGLEDDPQFWQRVSVDPYLQATATALGQVLSRNGSLQADA